MRFFYFCIISFCIFCTSCLNQPKHAITQFSTDTIYKESMPTPQGIYKGFLSCLDCNKIEQTIAFYTDKTYRIEEIYHGKQINPVVSWGKWEVKDSIVQLYEGKKLKKKLVWQGDNLAALDSIGKRLLIEKKMALLAKAPEHIWSNKAVALIKQKAPNLYAHGTEPFWSLEINNQKNTLFKMSDWKEAIILKTPVPTKSTDSTIYSFDAGGKFWITVYNWFCNDGMSDNIYEYKVKVNYKGQTYHGCGIIFK